MSILQSARHHITTQIIDFHIYVRHFFSIPTKFILIILFQPGPDADTIPRRLEPLPNLYTVPLEDGLKESPKQVRQK
jgi:hypothetical protein